MKKLLTELFFGKNSMTSGLIALAIISAIGLGCFCNKDKTGGLLNTSTPTPSATATASPTPAPTKAYTKADASKSQLPSDDEMQEIVRTTLLDFNDAVKKADFTDFHGNVSDKWQKQVTPEKFKEGFNQFIEKKIDIGGIRSEKANFTSGPKIDKSQSVSQLLVEGKYDISPTPVRFKLNYVPQGKEWKLFGIEVNTLRE